MMGIARRLTAAATSTGPSDAERADAEEYPGCGLGHHRRGLGYRVRPASAESRGSPKPLLCIRQQTSADVCGKRPWSPENQGVGSSILPWATT